MVQDDGHDALDAGFFEQACSDGECPAAAGGGGTEKNRTNRAVAKRLEPKGFFQMADMRNARKVFRAGWAMPGEGVELWNSADGGEVIG